MSEHHPVRIKDAPFNAESDPRALRLDQTPTDGFFIRSNFDEPALPDSHALVISGAVDAPYQLSMLELRSLPQRSLLVTVECAGNDRTGIRPLPPGEPWNTNAVGTARWTGVPLKLLLERAQVQRRAVEILFEAADGDSEHSFARALPLEKAFHEDTLIALQMNDAALTRAHGAPARLIVPGWYGMASVKWLKAIRAITEPFAGHFQTDRYVRDLGDGGKKEPVREMRVKSFIVSPEEGASAGEIILRGFAWSGASPISRVEVAVDGGDEWRPAMLGPDQGRWAWRSFQLTLSLPPGRHAIRSRATDERGNQQPDLPQWNALGYENNAIRVSLIDVR